MRRTLAPAALAGLLWAAAPARAVPTFSKEATVSLTTAAPLAFAGDYPSLRMYFLRASSAQAVLSASSADGLSWTVDSGSRLSTATLPSVSISSITGASLLSLTGGGYRMLYSIVSTTGAFRIHSATSSDGVSWANESDPAVDGATAFVGSPSLVKLSDGSWRLFFVRDQDGGDDLGDRRIYTARSTDQGQTWGSASLLTSTGCLQATALARTDGKVRLFYTQAGPSASSATAVASMLSRTTLADSYLDESGYRLSTSAAAGSLSFPALVRSTDTFRWRLYYSFSDPVQGSSGSVRSALLGPPDPASLSPSTVYTSAAARTFRLTGEGFSATAPTVAATRSGQTYVAATALTRADDQTLDFTLDMQGKEIGTWSLVVTNADGQTGTAAGALLVDYAPGSVSLTDNLLRPRLGGSMTIDTTIFTAGSVHQALYTLDGRLVRVLHHADHAAGSFTTSWDGKDAAGTGVASGLYILRSLGPKLDHRGKVLVIR